MCVPKESSRMRGKIHMGIMGGVNKALSIAGQSIILHSLSIGEATDFIK
jgi:hypothetical protein